MPSFPDPSPAHGFPPPEGLSPGQDAIVMGGDLLPDTLLAAYQWGYFPWSHPDEELLWWHPAERSILKPARVRITKSSRNLINQGRFRISYNTAFEEVIRGCQKAHRPGQEGTWISDELLRSFVQLHHRGHAFSVESWQGDTLVGGLYGLLTGKIFSGESMFSAQSNAGKIAFISLAQTLQQFPGSLIDCQVHNPYLESLGAYTVSRSLYLAHLQKHHPYDAALHKALSAK